MSVGAAEIDSPEVVGRIGSRAGPIALPFLFVLPGYNEPLTILRRQPSRGMTAVRCCGLADPTRLPQMALSRIA